MDWEKALGKLSTQNWIILMILGLASFFFMSSGFTLGVILGGLLIIANFSLLQHTVRRAFSPESAVKAKKPIMILKYYFRLAIMGIIIYILITRELVNPIGLTIGLSIIVISIIYLGIRAAWKTSSGKAI